MSVENNLRAGQVVIEDLLIISQHGRTVNLVNYLIEMNIFEDVFSPCMTANLLIRDASGLIHSLPIVGNEKIVVKFRTPTFDDSPENVIEKTFHVYSVSNRLISDDKETSYLLNLMSVEGYFDVQSTISMSYNGNTDVIASTIFEDYISMDRRFDLPGKKSELYISDTPHTSKIKYISNYWTPFKNLNFLCKRSRGAALFSSDYMFFENNKSFMFCSMEALISRSRSIGLLDEYVYELVPNVYRRKADGKKYFGNQVPTEMTRISNIETPVTIDSITGINVGYFSNTVIGFDFTTKAIIESTWNMRSKSSKLIKTGKHTPIPDGLVLNKYAHTQFVPYNTSLYEDYGITNKQDLPNGHPAEYYTDRIHARKSYLHSLNHAKLSLEIAGRTDIAAGQCISVLYPASGSKATNDTAADMLDPFFTGVYLISALRHVIRVGSHQIFVEAVKNGFDKVVS